MPVTTRDSANARDLRVVSVVAFVLATAAVMNCLDLKAVALLLGGIYAGFLFLRVLWRQGLGWSRLFGAALAYAAFLRFANAYDAFLCWEESWDTCRMIAGGLAGWDALTRLFVTEAVLDGVGLAGAAFLVWNLHQALRSCTLPGVRARLATAAATFALALWVHALALLWMRIAIFTQVKIGAFLRDGPYLVAGLIVGGSAVWLGVELRRTARAILTEDTRCCGCGYERHGIEEAMKCPECGERASGLGSGRPAAAR